MLSRFMHIFSQIFDRTRHSSCHESDSRAAARQADTAGYCVQGVRCRGTIPSPPYHWLPCQCQKVVCLLIQSNNMYRDSHGSCYCTSTYRIMYFVRRMVARTRGKLCTLTYQATHLCTPPLLSPAQLSTLHLFSYLLPYVRQVNPTP